MSTCGKCYREDVPVSVARCKEKPETLLGRPIGMYHCPDCGTMVLAGVPHPGLCNACQPKQVALEERPLVYIIQQSDGKVRTEINACVDYRDYGLLVCDLVRHLAKAYNIKEDAIWHWVDKERYHPTTGVTVDDGEVR